MALKKFQGFLLFHSVQQFHFNYFNISLLLVYSHFAVFEQQWKVKHKVFARIDNGTKYENVSSFILLHFFFFYHFVVFVLFFLQNCFSFLYLFPKPYLTTMSTHTEMMVLYQKALLLFFLLCFFSLGRLRVNIFRVTYTTQRSPCVYNQLYA